MPPVDTLAPDPATRLARLSLGILRNPRSGANLRAAAAMHGALAAHPGIPCRDVQDPPSVAQALREMAERGVDTSRSAAATAPSTPCSTRSSGAAHFPAGRSRRAARRHRQHDRARHRHARPPASRACLADPGVARGGEGLAVTGRPVMRIDPGAGRAPIHGMFFGAAAISQGIEYCKRNVHTLGLRGEIGPAVTMARFVIAMARGERAIVAPVPITVAVDDGPATLRLRDRARHDTGAAGAGAAALLGRRGRAAALRQRAREPAHWIRALPGSARGRPNRFVTPANGYESRNAHRSTSGSTRRSSSTASSFPRRPACRSRSRPAAPRSS